MQTTKPFAVLTSDVHYSVPTLELADASMRQAINKANELKLPLIVAGDLHDTKANMRAECVNAMIATFSRCQTKCFILIGNHDLINEKSDENALEFLDYIGETVDETFGEKQISIVRRPWWFNELGAINGNSVHLIPYHSDSNKLRAYLAKVDANSCIIMHQGLQGSNSGEYYQDLSAITHADVKDFRVISGHYHARQDIKTGRPRKGAVGLWSYIGNPYTTNFGEASDPEKGFQILMSDGTLEFVPTNLPKHIKLDITVGTVYALPHIRSEDKVWVRIHGKRDELTDFVKDRIVATVSSSNIRVELIDTDIVNILEEPKSTTQPELLEQIIDNSTSEETAKRLKALWRSM